MADETKISRRRNRKTKAQMAEQLAKMVNMLKDGMGQHEIMMRLDMSATQYKAYLGQALAERILSPDAIRPKRVLVNSIPSAMLELMPDVKGHEDQYFFIAEPADGSLLVKAIPKASILRVHSDAACPSQTEATSSGNKEEIIASDVDTEATETEKGE
jgi:hypothetical protein